MSTKLIYGGVGANYQMQSISEFIQYIASHKPIHDVWHRRMSDDNIALVSTVFCSTVVKALFLWALTGWSRAMFLKMLKLFAMVLGRLKFGNLNSESIQKSINRRYFIRMLLRRYSLTITNKCDRIEIIP